MAVLTPVWYVEIMSPTGAWHAQLVYGRAPAEQTVDGKRKFRMAPQLVPLMMLEPTQLPMDQIKLFLSPDGEFFGYEPDVIIGVVEFLRGPDAAMVIREDQRNAS